MNLHEKCLIRSLVLCVCQFRHVRTFEVETDASADYLNIISDFLRNVNDFFMIIQKIFPKIFPFSLDRTVRRILQ